MNKRTHVFLLIFFTSVLVVYQGSIYITKAARNASISTPTGFRVLERTPTQITLTWDKVDPASKYVIYKWDGDSYEKYGPDISQGTFTFTDTDLYCLSRDYGDFYKITAKNSAGEESAQSNYISAPPENDQFSEAIDLKTTPGMPGTATFNTCNATLTYSGATILDPQIEECDLNHGKATVWYKFTATSTDNAFSIDTKGLTSYDTFVAVWTGTEADYNNGTLDLVACGNDTENSSQSQVAFSTIDGTTYYVEVGQYDGAFGTLSSNALRVKPWE